VSLVYENDSLPVISAEIRAAGGDTSGAETNRFAGVLLEVSIGLTVEDVDMESALVEIGRD
jgi:hypothetical protein